MSETSFGHKDAKSTLRRAPNTHLEELRRLIKAGNAQGWEGTQGLKKKKNHKKGGWVAQWVEHPTLGFGSGHDLMVRGIEPQFGAVLSAQSLLGILSASPPHAHALSQK